MSDDQPLCIDPSVLGALRRELGADGEAVVQEVVQAFPGDARVQLDRFVVSAPAGELAKAAHRLRGSALNLGAVRLAAVCASAETLGMAGDQAGAFGLRGAIAAELAQVIAMIPTLSQPVDRP